jgi:hypothetical protein
MLHRLVCAAALVAVWATAGVAEDRADKDKKKGQTVTGLIKKVDPSASHLIVGVKKGKDETDQEVRITGATKAVLFDGKERKELTGKDLFKRPELKEGTRVRAVIDDQGRALELHVNPPAEKKD